MNPDPPSTEFLPSHEVFREVLESWTYHTDFRLECRKFICREAVESLLGQPCRATRLLCVFSTEQSEGAHEVAVSGPYGRSCQGRYYQLSNLYDPLSELLLKHRYTLYLTLTPL